MTITGQIIVKEGGGWMLGKVSYWHQNWGKVFHWHQTWVKVAHWHQCQDGANAPLTNMLRCFWHHWYRTVLQCKGILSPTCHWPYSILIPIDPKHWGMFSITDHHHWTSFPSLMTNVWLSFPQWPPILGKMVQPLITAICSIYYKYPMLYFGLVYSINQGIDFIVLTPVLYVLFFTLHTPDPCTLSYVVYHSDCCTL